MPLTICTAYPTQREIAANPELHPGEAEAQELEEGAEGTAGMM